MDKNKDYEKIDVHPVVSMLSDIQIKENDIPIGIGGFSIGGFYLEEPYILKENKKETLSGKNVTYYSFVKDKKLQSERERKLREHYKQRDKQEEESLKSSIKDAKEIIKNYTEKLKGFKKQGNKSGESEK